MAVPPRESPSGEDSCLAQVGLLPEGLAETDAPAFTKQLKLNVFLCFFLFFSHHSPKHSPIKLPACKSQSLRVCFPRNQNNTHVSIYSHMCANTHRLRLRSAHNWWPSDCQIPWVQGKYRSLGCLQGTEMMKPLTSHGERESSTFSIEFSTLVSLKYHLELFRPRKSVKKKTHVFCIQQMIAGLY